MATASQAELWNRLADEAAAQSALWAECLRPIDEQVRVPVFSPHAAPRYALGVETIYEGYLLHYGCARVFAATDADTALLLGDYLYAHGLVRITNTGDIDAVHDLAELISLCAQARADGTDGDGYAWAATAACLGTGGLDTARSALRDRGDSGELASVARDRIGASELARALTLHGQLARVAG